MGSGGPGGPASGPFRDLLGRAPIQPGPGRPRCLIGGPRGASMVGHRQATNNGVKGNRPIPVREHAPASQVLRIAASETPVLVMSLGVRFTPRLVQRVRTRPSPR